MKRIAIALPILSSIFVLGALTGCATELHQKHHPGSTNPTAAPVEKTSTSSSAMPMMGSDKSAMCEMHEKMMSAKNADERRTLMTAHMKSMPPDMMKKHMAMMHEQMTMMQEHMGSQAK